MNFNTLLEHVGLDPSTVLVLRHSPKQPALYRIMPWLITEKPASFNAYQQTQTPRVQQQMSKCKYVASFFGHETDKAAFVGIYKHESDEWVTQQQVRQIPAHVELLKYGLSDRGPKRLWFHLRLTKLLAERHGKLIIKWPRPSLVWSRWANRNTFEIDSIVEESVFVPPLSDWRSLVFTWDDLQMIPRRWKDILSQWHGIYLIWDGRDRKAYVGAAYGKDGLLQRWLQYRQTGHGGNKLLRSRNPDQFQFSILEWMPSDTDAEEVRNREKLWKQRLHTRSPHGLNDN
jgi:hypothetical protein